MFSFWLGWLVIHGHVADFLCGDQCYGHFRAILSHATGHKIGQRLRVDFLFVRSVFFPCFQVGGGLRFGLGLSVAFCLGCLLCLGGGLLLGFQYTALGFGGFTLGGFSGQS